MPRQVPLEGLIAAANCGAHARGPRRSRPTASPAARRATRASRVPRRQAQARRRHRLHGRRILVTSGSLQALDLVNGVMLARGDTVIIEQECYQGSINRMTRLGVSMVGIPLDRDGMRIDALAGALADLKRQGIRPKYIYTIPTVQNPTGTILPESRRAEMLRLADRIRRADLRGRLLRRPDLGPQAAARDLRHEQDGERHPHRLVLEVDRAGAARRLHRRAMGDHVAHAGDSRPTPAPARWSRWCWRNTARRISPSMCRC